jgi:hypothetical protein
MNNKLVVVADLGYFKVYKLEPGNLHSTPRLELVEEINLMETQTKLPVMDLSGAYHAPMSGKWAASSGERHNIDLERRRRVIKQVAHFLSALLRQDRSDGCYFAASKDISHQILAELPREARLKIEKVITCDLTKADKSELLRRFEVVKTKFGETPFLAAREPRRTLNSRQQL